LILAGTGLLEWAECGQSVRLVTRNHPCHALGSEKSSMLVSDSILKVYPGAPHGLFAVDPFKDELSSDLLEFIGA
jgi:hypothetical protein